MPPPLTTTAQVRQVGNLPTSTILADDRISAFFKSAEYKLRSWLTDTVYDAAVAAAGGTEPKVRFTLAEAYLVCYYGVRASWNMAVTQQGMMQSKQLGGEGGNIELLSKAERESLAAEFLAMAEETAGSYIVSDGGGAFEFLISRADYEDDEA